MQLYASLNLNQKTEDTIRLREQELERIKAEDMGKPVRITIPIPEKLLKKTDIQVRKGY